MFWRTLEIIKWSFNIMVNGYSKNPKCLVKNTLVVLLVKAEGQKGGHDRQAQKSKKVKVFLCLPHWGFKVL